MSNDRPITTRVHGIIDYITGPVLILAPWIFRFHHDAAATAVAVGCGIFLLAYSLLTRYEFGAYRVIPMKAHLALDVLGGVFLALSPWLFHFFDYIIWPHVLVGAFEIVTPLLTQHRPGPSVDDRREPRRDVPSPHM